MISAESIKNERLDIIKGSIMKDTGGSRFGMWLFLYTEIMLFGGLFILYASYYYKYKTGFISGGKELDLTLGVFNTAILLTSSFAVASSITALQKKSIKTSLLFLFSAVFFGIAFLAVKYIEWGHKISTGIYPGSDFFKTGDMGKTVFFSLYFTITGLHALHVFIGIVILSLAAVFVAGKKITPENHIFLENAGLYWHLVDIIWIFIFPLLYLII